MIHHKGIDPTEAADRFLDKFLLAAGAIEFQLYGVRIVVTAFGNELVGGILRLLIIKDDLGAGLDSSLWQSPFVA